MRLTVACLFRHTINGNIFAGKYRLVKKVTGSAVKRLKEDFAREDQIMKLLRNPYLTKVKISLIGWLIPLGFDSVIRHCL